MKWIKEHRDTVTIILFIVGVLFSGWLLFNLANDLVYKSSIINLNDLEKIQPILNKLYIVIGLVFLLGILSIVFLITKKKNTATKVISEMVKNISSNDHSIAEQVEEKIGEADYSEFNHVLHDKQEKNKKLNTILSKLCGKLEAVQGTLYLTTTEKKINYIEMVATYAFHKAESETIKYEFGEGLAGQVAKEGNIVNLDDIPEGYIRVVSGLGDSSPSNLLIIPIKNNGKIVGVAEIASFQKFEKKQIDYASNIFKLTADKLLAKEKAAAKKAVKKTAALKEVSVQD